MFIRPFTSSFFFLSNFQTLIFFVTLFSATLRPRKLKHGTRGQWADVSCIPESGCWYLFVPLFLHFSFSPNFQTLKFFVTLFSGAVRPRRLKLGTHVDSGQMYHVCRNQPAFAYSSLFSFSPVFKHLNFSSHFSQKLCDLEVEIWHTRAVGRCIVFTRIRLLLLIHAFIFHFSLSPIFKH